MEHEYPPVARRIADARERLKLDPADAAGALGMSFAAYADLETYDDEAFMCISIQELRALGRVLNVSPRGLVAPEGADQMCGELAPAEIVEAIRQRLRANSSTLEQFEEEAGWSVSSALNDPETIWADWNLDALQDICRVLGVNWLLAVPDRP